MIKTVLSAATLTAGLGAATAFAADLEPIISPVELQAYLAEDDSAPVVLDIRGGGYEKGHIAGAVSAPYGLFRGLRTTPALCCRLPNWKRPMSPLASIRRARL